MPRRAVVCYRAYNDNAGKHRMTRSMIAAALFAATLLPAGAAFSQSGIATTADTLIETRQSGQDVVYGVVADMKAAVAAKADPKQYADGAMALSRWFKNFPSLFPAGTESGHDTKAKPEIWSDTAGFIKASQAASDAAAALAAAAKSGDQAEFAAKFQALGQTCGACHKVYKVKT